MCERIFRQGNQMSYDKQNRNCFLILFYRLLMGSVNRILHEETIENDFSCRTQASQDCLAAHYGNKFYIRFLS